MKRASLRTDNISALQCTARKNIPMKMESRSMMVNRILAVFLVMQLGLIPIMAQKEELQTGIAGQKVILNCKGITHEAPVTWKYNAIVVRWFRSSHMKGKAPMTDRSEMDQNNKSLMVSDLRLSDAGSYSCECESRPVVTISLHVFELTISLNGHFLPNEAPELSITQNSSDSQPDLSIRLFNNHNNTETPEILRKEAPRKYILKLKKLQPKDSGTWRCHIHSDSPLINQNIVFDLKVLGFQNPALERKYSTVDSTVNLSWHLNFQEIKWKEGFTGQLNWKPQGNTTSYMLFDFNVTAWGKQHVTKKSSPFLFEENTTGSSGVLEVKLKKVQFKHSGQYQIQLVYNRRYVQSKIELLVMKVLANPVGPLARGAEMTLLCQVSSPLPPNAHLCWERVNGTQMDFKKSKQNEAKVEVTVSTAGLWNCHLIEDNNRKISLNYTVEEAPVWISYVVIGASTGASVLVFGIACLCIIAGMSWQRRRQRAKRMALARQHWLENRTCQCQHRLN
ncbi:T-cell surface glycoprotein CD4 [Apteryx mantelli]|uniref:T-cell surface glycoprotein CD4 n=1 Tax=Apteryx mantelli TaxID=2696672 RepID=A0ABM4DZK4_9AVES